MCVCVWGGHCSSIIMGRKMVTALIHWGSETGREGVTAPVPFRSGGESLQCFFPGGRHFTALNWLPVLVSLAEKQVTAGLNRKAEVTALASLDDRVPHPLD